jgi:hypothetical protein
MLGDSTPEKIFFGGANVRRRCAFAPVKRSTDAGELFFCANVWNFSPAGIYM